MNSYEFMKAVNEMSVFEENGLFKVVCVCVYILCVFFFLFKENGLFKATLFIAMNGKVRGCIRI